MVLVVSSLLIEEEIYATILKLCYLLLVFVSTKVFYPYTLFFNYSLKAATETFLEKVIFSRFLNKMYTKNTLELSFSLSLQIKLMNIY